jgi:hypothetical protein
MAGTTWKTLAIFILIVAAGGMSNAAFAQQMNCGPMAINPPSSVERPGDVGARAHTNILVLRPCPAPGSQNGQAPSYNPGVNNSMNSQQNGATNSSPPQSRN